MDNVADIYPLGPTQEGILYHALSDTDPASYFEQVSCDLIGDLDIGRLRRAWADVFARHPALRTAFVWSGVKNPLQVVREAVELPWTELDLRDDPDADHTLEGLAAESRQAPFDLQRAPVTRLTVARLDDRRAHLRWDFHHILLDGWSAVMVFEEVLQRYRRPDAPLAPGRPARAHVEWAKRQDVQAARRHWSALLAGHEPGAELLVATPGRPGQFSRARFDHSAGTVLGEMASRMVRANRLTLNTLVQGAWALTLERLTDRDDVVFGVVTSGRPADLPGIEETVGMFLATLPFRVKVDSEQSVLEWLSAIQQQQSEMLAHQHLPLASIRSAAGIEPGTELFESVLVFENYPQAPADDGLDMAGAARIEVADKQVFEQTHYPLTIMVMPGDELRYSVLYDASRLGEDDVARVMALFESQLEALVGGLDARPLEVSTLTRTDRESLRRWNDTTTPIPPPPHLGRWLEDVAAGRSVTVTEHGTGRRMTLHELEKRAAATAGLLADRGIGQGDVVGIRLERSLELIAAAWASWKLGAAYAPLGPTTPQERIDAAVAAGGIALVLDDPADVLEARCSPSAPLSPPPAAADEVACVVFTSGSTGAPKPVEITHLGLANRFSWQLGRYPVEPGETGMAKTSLDFVDHLWELWGPLVGGGDLVLVDDETVRDPRRFLDAVAAHRPRRLTIVPSLLDALLDSATPDAVADSLGRLRWLTVSGEALSWALVHKVERLLPGVTLSNFYGMSEGTADVTWFEHGEPLRPGTSPPIGRPIDNVTVQVLDRHRRPSPVGVAGELFVGGLGLARGYRNQPEATAAAFGGGSERLYRTGDLGRWLPSGVLEYVGRRDRQVKIRGVRVEPAGVEEALSCHEAMAEAVVVAAGEGPDQRLVAYVRLREGSAEPAMDDVRTFLRSRLVEQAVPSRIAVVESFPRLPSGKIDRSALAGMAASASGAPTIARRDPSEAEATMIGLWTDVLGSQVPIGPDDDFFAVGGDSLAALRLFSRIDREYGRDLPLAEVFSAPTPASMVRRLGLGEEAAGDSDAASGARPVVLGSSSSPGVLAALARRLTDVATLVEVADEGGFPESLPAIVTDEDPLILCGHGDRARAVLELGVASALRGRRPAVVLLIDAAITAGELARLAATGPGPERLVFLEPAETDGRDSLIPAETLRRRLADRSASGGWAGTTDVVLIPGDSATALTEPNVSWLAHLVVDQLGLDRTQHLVRISGGPESRRTLFAVHGEYGNIVGYRDLAVALGDDWSLVGVQASGVYGTRPLHGSIEEMAEAYLTELLAWQPVGPYLLAGYSAGGTIAFEMARRLTAAGHEVEALVWFDHYRMGATKPENVAQRAMRLGRNRLRVALTDTTELRSGIERRRLSRMLSRVETAASDSWWMEISRVAADQADVANMRSLLISRSVQAARRRYHHGPYDGPIILYEAEMVDEARSPDRGWNEDELNIVRVPVPGEHETVLLVGVEAIADDLRRRFRH